MSLICLASAKGSPGVTATTLALAAAMPVDGTSGWASTTRVVFEPSSWGAADHDGARQQNRSAGLRVTGDRPFASVWNDFSSANQGVSAVRTRFKP